MLKMYNINKRELKQYAIMDLPYFKDTPYLLVKVKGTFYVGCVNGSSCYINHKMDRIAKVGMYFVTVEHFENDSHLRVIDIYKNKIVSLGVYKEYEIYNDCIKVKSMYDKSIMLDSWYIDDRLESGVY